MNNSKDDPKPEIKSTNHWVMWTLLVVFIVGSIAAMMMADYLFAPGSGGNVEVPKDAADK